MQPRDRQPTTPGDLLRKQLRDLNIFRRDFAAHISESYLTILEVTNDQERVTPELARKFGDAFGQSPEFWLRAQMEVDVWSARNDFEPTPMLACVRETLVRDRDESEMPPDDE